MSTRRPRSAKGQVCLNSTMAVIAWYRTPVPSMCRCRGVVVGCCCWLSVRRHEVPFKVFCSSGKSLAKVKILVSGSFSRTLLPLTSTPP